MTSFKVPDMSQVPKIGDTTTGPGSTAGTAEDGQCDE